jgi:hypothetical protein
MRHIRLIVVAFIFACGVLLPANVHAGSISARITPDNTLVTWRFTAEQGTDISAVMSRVSGDLIPFLALQNTDEETLERAEAQPGESSVELRFTIETSGEYILVATRYDLDAGTTTGDFILSVNGATLTEPINPDLDLPIVADTPAILLEPASMMRGNVSDAQSAIFYLTFVEARSTLEVTIQRTSGDLQPQIVLLDLEQNVISRDGVAEGDQYTVTYEPTRDEWVLVAATRVDVDAGTTSGNYVVIRK